MSGKNKPRGYFVIGEGRSGTSMVAHLMHEMGVYMGDRLKGGNHGNPDGYWENMDLVKFNIKVLEDNGFDITKYPVPRPDLVKEKVGSKYDGEAKELITQFQKGLWGAKDPRFLFTYEVYRPFIENMHLIICFRNPLSVAHSLKHQDNKPVGQSLRTINDYYHVLYNFLERNDLPVLTLKYEDFFESDEQIGKLARFLEVEPRKRYNKIIKRSLKHF